MQWMWGKLSQPSGIITSKSHWGPFSVHLGLEWLMTVKYWRGCGGNEKSIHCWWECRISKPVMSNLKAPQKTKNSPPTCPSRLTLGYISVDSSSNDAIWGQLNVQFLSSIKVFANICFWRCAVCKGWLHPVSSDLYKICGLRVHKDMKV